MEDVLIRSENEVRIIFYFFLSKSFLLFVEVGFLVLNVVVFGKVYFIFYVCVMIDFYNFVVFGY